MQLGLDQSKFAGGTTEVFKHSFLEKFEHGGVLKENADRKTHHPGP